ncbi:MAG: tetratricopeptide repeat protein [Mangrovibacterium sp.]
MTTKTKILPTAILTVTFLIVSVSSHAQNERKYIRSGNRIYEKALADTTQIDTLAFSNAEVEYRKALAKRPDDLKWQTNLGDALFMQANFPEAQETFTNVAENSTDKMERATAFFNLGNSYLAQNKLEESIDAYKNALRNNPSDLEAKHNLLFAMKKKDEQQQDQNKDNQDQNKDNQDQNKDKQDQNKDNQDQNKDKQDQNKDKQDQNKDKQDQNKDKQDQNKDNQDQNKDNQDPNKDNQNQGAQQKISKENAERMLQALENDEKKTQEKVKKAQAAEAKQRKTDKDW